MRNIGWSQHTQRIHCIEPHRFTLVSDLIPRTIFAICAVNDLVVDVGDIGDQTHLNT